MGSSSNPFSINSATGLITGTPVSAGTVPVTLTVTDASGSTSEILNLTILPAATDTTVAFQQGVTPSASYTVPSRNNRQ